MEFAPIVPIKYHPADVTKYHLILAHQVVKSLQYRNYYCSLPKDHSIILDNSVIELGYTDTAMIVEALEFLNEFQGRMIVVCPDVLRDRAATVKAHREFMNDNNIADILGRNGHHVMVVPQGSDSNDWAHCLDELDSKLIGSFTYVGIPRLTEDFEGGRLGLYNNNIAALQGYRVHLLGVQHTLNEIEWAKEHPDIVGCDSSLPLRAAYAGISCEQVVDLRTLPDPDKYEQSMYQPVRHRIKECHDFVSNDKDSG